MSHVSLDLMLQSYVVQVLHTFHFIILILLCNFWSVFFSFFRFFFLFRGSIFFLNWVGDFTELHKLAIEYFSIAGLTEQVRIPEIKTLEVTDLKLKVTFAS